MFGQTFVCQTRISEQSQFENANDLIKRLGNVDLSQKTLISYDVTSLFTNVSIKGTLKAPREVVNNMRDNDIPLGKKDFSKLVSLCVKFGPSVFNNEEYFQCHGLAMGSSLSALLASLYMELLERDNFITIIGWDTTCMQKVDDVLVIAPREIDLNVKLKRLNRIKQDKQFTVEHKENNRLAFLHIVIWSKRNNTSFSVHRKGTNKIDVMHSYSTHNDKIESIIGSFLRTY
ncbi:uncharacterized protein LOC143019919 [Oratosquilla oratoria]|uniref:uncharacterized protein LOC143019919 n=1 Tax=Oratosquilla oratoria TaxID=337810 RepID=UPI003F7684B2